MLADIEAEHVSCLPIRFCFSHRASLKPMTITLKSEQEKFIQEKLKTGKYKTVDAVIIEAFRLLEQRDKHYEKWLEETRKKVAVGLEQLNRGEGIEGEIVINRFKEKLRALREAQP